MLDIRMRLKMYKQLNPNELTPQQFKKIEKEMKEKDAPTISDEYLDFKLWCNGYPSRQEAFANYIAKRLEPKKGATILEVGCGRTGRLSRILSTKGFKMIGMDPKVEVRGGANVEFIKQEFDYRSADLAKYDFIIAQEPCEATEHIIRACVAQDKPFIIALCGTPHKLISGKMPEDVYKWWDYLISIDKDNIKYRSLDLDPFTHTPILKSNF